MLKDQFYSLKGDTIMPRPVGAVFIVFEGPDGAGKSTQAALLKTYLEGKGKTIYLTKEPTSETEAGRKAREILNSKTQIDPGDLQKLFVEDRREHLDKGIIPALKEGQVVICDRYFFSTFAYGYIDNPDIHNLVDLNKDFIMPDVTLALIVDPERCIERLKGRAGSIDHFEKVEKLRKVNEAYKMLAGTFETIRLIDGEKTIEEVQKEIINLLEAVIK